MYREICGEEEILAGEKSAYVVSLGAGDQILMNAGGGAEDIGV